MVMGSHSAKKCNEGCKKKLLLSCKFLIPSILNKSHSLTKLVKIISVKNNCEGGV